MRKQLITVNIYSQFLLVFTLVFFLLFHITPQSSTLVDVICVH